MLVGIALISAAICCAFIAGFVFGHLFAEKHRRVSFERASKAALN